MSAWKNSDKVTTTYGSIQLSLEQAHAAGIKTEQKRIVEMFEEGIKECASGNPKSCDHCLSVQFYVAMIKGDSDRVMEIVSFVEAMQGDKDE